MTCQYICSFGCDTQKPMLSSFSQIRQSSMYSGRASGRASSMLSENDIISCGLPTVGGFSLCDIHKCRYVGCAGQKCCDSPYCVNHMCKYVIENEYGVDFICHNSVMTGENFCPSHMCFECHNQIVDKKSKYCKNHMTHLVCAFGNCTESFCIRDPSEKMWILNTTIRNIRTGDMTLNNKWCCFKHTCEQCHRNMIAHENTKLCQKCEPIISNPCMYSDCTNHCIEIDTYCKKHELLDQLCRKNYGFNLDHLKIFEFLTLSDFRTDNVKIKIMLSVLDKARK